MNTLRTAQRVTAAIAAVAVTLSILTGLADAAKPAQTDSLVAATIATVVAH